PRSGMLWRSSSFRVGALGKFFDGLAAERVEILWRATGHQAVVDVDFLIHPLATGILDVCAQAWIRGNCTTVEHIGLNENPRRMADGGNRFGLLEEFPD